MEVVVVVFGVLFLLFVCFGAVAAYRVARAVSRGVERTGVQVRRGVTEASLKAKAAQPGALGQAARIRLELRSSIDGARRSVEVGAEEDPSLREALDLLDQLHEHARQLDTELRLLTEGQPNRARVAQRLPEVQARVARVTESADSLRDAAQERRQRFHEDGLDSLRARIEVESGALRHWERAEPGSSDEGRSGVAGAGAQDAVEQGREQAEGPGQRKRQWPGVPGFGRRGEESR